MNNKINWDTLGITASLVCAIHCAVLPLVFTSLPIFGVNVIENTAFEVGMVFLAFIVGSYSLYHGFKKHHRSFLPLIVFTSGFVFLVLKLLWVQYEKWLLIPAVVGIVWAHLINYKSCQMHKHVQKASSKR